MNTWVEINLPWSKNEAVEAKANKLKRRGDKFYAKAVAKAEKELGVTLEQVREKLYNARVAELQRKQGEDFDGLPCCSTDLDPIKKRYPELDVNLLCDPPDCCDVDWLARVLKRVKRSPVACALAEYYHDKYRYDREIEAQPEYVKAEDLADEARELIRLGSFRNHLGSHEMLRPGVLIEVKHGDKVRPLLIGHMGPAGGPAEWEMGEQVIEETDMVLRAMVVWSEE